MMASNETLANKSTQMLKKDLRTANYLFKNCNKETLNDHDLSNAVVVG